MKVIGWIMVIVSGLIIIYNVATTNENKQIAALNEQKANADPWGTIFLGGANLIDSKPCYTFTPPYSGFELTVLAAGVIGLGIVICGPSGSKPKPLPNPE